jgi:hypothetical protein
MPSSNFIALKGVFNFFLLQISYNNELRKNYYSREKNNALYFEQD